MARGLALLALLVFATSASAATCDPAGVRSEEVPSLQIPPGLDSALAVLRRPQVEADIPKGAVIQQYTAAAIPLAFSRAQSRLLGVDVAGRPYYLVAGRIPVDALLPKACDGSLDPAQRRERLRDRARLKRLYAGTRAFILGPSAVNTGFGFGGLAGGAATASEFAAGNSAISGVVPDGVAGVLLKTPKSRVKTVIPTAGNFFVHVVANPAENDYPQLVAWLDAAGNPLRTFRLKTTG